jgi:hypothetical protein
MSIFPSGSPLSGSSHSWVSETYDDRPVVDVNEVRSLGSDLGERLFCQLKRNTSRMNLRLSTGVDCAQLP